MDSCQLFHGWLPSQKGRFFNMKRSDRITPEGTRDLLFEECVARRRVEGLLRQLFETNAFREVMTPGFEFYDVFDANAGDFPQESMYKLVDGKGRLLVVRPDSTIPIARLTATKLQGHRLPIRLYYAQRIYRSRPTMSGRSDEAMQMGVELIGSGSPKADLEVLTTAAQSLDSCGVADYRMEIGHIGIYKQLMEGLDVSGQVKEDIRSSIESKNYAALNDLLDGIGESPIAGVLKKLPALFGGREVFSQARTLFEIVHDPDLEASLDYLEEIYQSLEALGLGDRVMVDFGMVNQAEYYTGIIFRGYTAAVGEPVLSGGRYDRLCGSFGESLAAVGFAVDVDSIANVLLDRGEIRADCPRLLVFGDRESVSSSLSYFRQLTRQGILCEYSLFDTLQESMEYAAQRGIGEVHRLEAGQIQIIKLV